MNLRIKKRKWLLKRVMLAGILISLIFIFYSLSNVVALQLFQRDLFQHHTAVLFISIFLSVLLYRPTEHLALFLSRRVLRISQSPGQAALAKLVRDMVTVLDPNELASLIANTFGEVVGVRSASVLIFHKSKGVFRIASAYGFPSNTWQTVELASESPLLQLLRDSKRPLERERVIRSFSWQEATQLTHEFDRLSAMCVTPVLFQDELVGTINITQRVPNKEFTSGDLKLFADFAREAGPAFRNAMLVEELREANQELTNLQADLLHANQRSAIERLATGIAHEIHNPLTIISGKAQILLLKRDQKLYDSQVEDVLKTIVKQTKRAADITRKLLMFSDTRKQVTEVVDLEEVMNDTIALLSYQVTIDQIQIVKRIEHPIPKWQGNVGDLREAFLNLFLNAVEAIGEKGTIETSLRYDKQEKVIEFRISDTGRGIPEVHMSKLFHPFFTTHEGSCGLGLFVTQQIISRHGGTIRPESREAQGATFVVELPCESHYTGVSSEGGAPKTGRIPEHR